MSASQMSHAVFFTCKDGMIESPLEKIMVKYFDISVSAASSTDESTHSLWRSRDVLTSSRVGDSKGHQLR